MNPLTLRELELRRAQLAERAERLRQEHLTLPYNQRALSLGKEAKALQVRADDYEQILKSLEET